MVFINIIPPKALNRLHILCRKNAAIFQPATPKIEKQTHRRIRGFQIIDDLRQFIICELMAECLDLYNHLLNWK